MRKTWNDGRKRLSRVGSAGPLSFACFGLMNGDRESGPGRDGRPALEVVQVPEHDGGIARRRRRGKGYMAHCRPEGLALSLCPMGFGVLGIAMLLPRLRP